MKTYTLLPEWHRQAAVLLTWPHAETDWRDSLDAVEKNYVDLALAIARFGKLVVAAPQHCHHHIVDQLKSAGLDSLDYRLFDIVSDDTWARDHGPLTVSDGRHLRLLDFTFNGWGNKFSAQRDNAITRCLSELGAFAVDVQTVDFVLEGGAVEIDASGAVLTTSTCLLHPNRNGPTEKAAVEQMLQKWLGARKVNWLEHGYLEGDDTDSHIDTLARLVPDNRIVYVGCDDPADSHYEPLNAMKRELQALENADGERYQLFELPWPDPIYGSDGERLPATYANFLILNGAVLVPVYGDTQDNLALAVIGEAFCDYEIIGINCRALIEQHGSLHCVTMQLPEGVISF